jgi:hypothetical protein
VQYAVYRVDAGSGGCASPSSGADECLFSGTLVATTRETSFGLPSGGGTYRIAAAANYLDDQNGGDLMLLGPPVTVP